MPKAATLAVLMSSVLLLAGNSVAYAQSTYTGSNGTVYSVPDGFQPYSYGIYYNSTNRVYYNPVTGQFSSTAPLGPASVNSSGMYVIPAGYSSSMYGTYYSPSTGLYYDPATGFYSSIAPSGPLYPPPTYYTNPNGVRYAVPAGYQPFSSNGIYYNSANGMYFNPVTGQYSTTLPAGQASVNSSGAYNIPAGYVGSVYGTYYNPGTGLYYDPVTGFYSSSLPLGPTYGSTATTPTPTLPNTGAGGNSLQTMLFLAITAVTAAAGTATLRKQALSKN